MNILASSLASSLFSTVALNPQPLPPKPLSASSSLWNSAINPQPLPPGAVRSASLWNALNPQPLPPGFAPSNGAEQRGIIIIGGRQISLDDYCGNGNGKPPIPHIGTSYSLES